MAGRLSSWGRALARRLSRSEWAIRHLGLVPSAGTRDAPGLLLIQIDGLARHQFERALARGGMPFLRALTRRGGYEMHTFYPGVPSTTAAVQAELYYGVPGAVPAFSFYRRDREACGRMSYPTWAKDVEARCAEGAEGLLAGGSSWSNIYTGGAGQDEAHFCAASVGLGDMWATGKLRNILVFIVCRLGSTLRIAGLLLAESAMALVDTLRAVGRGRPLGAELHAAVSRIFISVGLRELVTTGAAVDLARGLPVVHVNFLGYDEQSHARGPAAVYAHWTLQGIDRAVKTLFRAAHRSPRRDYAVWIFSDHGQERTRQFAAAEPDGLAAVVAACARRVPGLGPLRQVPSLATAEPGSFCCAALGPVGHVYFPSPPAAAARRAFAAGLVRSGGVPGVLVKDETGVCWHHAGGVARSAAEVEAVLPHAPAVRAELARDLMALGAIADAGDLILLGWAPGTAAWSFAPERGAHGGIGPEEMRGFALLPARTALPAAAEAFIRPAALRAAALHLLGRRMLEDRLRRSADPADRRIRLLVCDLADDPRPPGRTARVLASLQPDVIVLRRGGGGARLAREAAVIADQLEMHPPVAGGADASRGDDAVVVLTRGAPAVAEAGSAGTLWLRLERAGGGWHLGAQPPSAAVGGLRGPDGAPPGVWLEAAAGRAEPVVVLGGRARSPGAAQPLARWLRPVAPGRSRLRRLGRRPDRVLVSSEWSTAAAHVPWTEPFRAAGVAQPLVLDLELPSELTSGTT